MSDVIRQIVRNATPLTGLVTAVIGLAIAMDWVALTDVQIGAIMGVLGAAILALRAWTTPVDDPVLPIGTIVNANTNSQPTGVVMLQSDPAKSVT